MTFKLECEYCGRLLPFEELEERHEKLVCKDIKACDRASIAGEEAEESELRKRQREGDELTEAEKKRLRGS